MVLKFISLSIFAISILPISLFLSKDRSYFYPWMKEMPGQFIFGSILIILLFIIFTLIPKEKHPRFISKSINKLSESHYVLIIAVVIIFITTNIISFLIFEHIPHVQDSICQLFNAKIFLSGKLYASPPVHKEFFRFLYIIDDNKWYSQYPPVHSFLLMLGLLFQAPWLINPVLGILSAVVLYKISRNIYDLKNANLSLILFTFSPFFIFMSSEYMNHASTMFFILLFVWYFIKTIKAQSIPFSFISGVSLGIALNIRPLTAVSASLPFIFYFLYLLLNDKKFFKIVISFVFGFSLMLLLLLTYNYLTNGDPLLFGYNAYEKKSHLLGFVEVPSEGINHTPFKGFINTFNNLNAMNKYLFEWPIPSLSFVFLFFFFKVDKNKWDKLFIFSSLSLTAAYFFHYFPYLTFGPRFLYCSMPFLVLLTARGILCIPEVFSKKTLRSRESYEFSMLLILLICISFMLIFSFPKLLKEYKQYFNVDKSLFNYVKKNKVQNAVVFINTGDTPYSNGFQYNSPELDGDIIFVRNLGQKNIELMKEFPNRKYFIYYKNRNTQQFELKSLSRGATY